jgi:hypothetical protein
MKVELGNVLRGCISETTYEQIPEILKELELIKQELIEGLKEYKVKERIRKHKKGLTRNEKKLAKYLGVEI